MTWRWAWARSRITALVASGLIWLVAVALSPAFVAGYALVGVVVVAGWRSRPVLWWRFGVGPVAPAIAEAVWRALVPVEWLRGRNQPQLLAGSWVGEDVIAADRHTLVFSDTLVAAIDRHEVADGQVCRLVVRASATADVSRSRTVAVAEVWCLPWSILADLAGRVSGKVATLRVVRFSWSCRWLFIGLAAIDLYGRRHWLGLTMLCFTAMATVTTHRWNRAWSDRQVALADNLEHTYTAPSDRWSSRPITRAGTHRSRPASSRGAR